MIYAISMTVAPQGSPTQENAILVANHLTNAPKIGRNVSTT